MPLPGNWTAVTLTGEFQLYGDALKGTATFTPSVWVTNAGANVMQPPGGKRVHLDNDGRFSVPLPVVDDPDITPTGWTYRVDLDLVVPSTGFRITRSDDYQITAAMAPTVDLADVAPVTAVVEVTPYLRGVDLGTVVETPAGAQAKADAVRSLLNVGVKRAAFSLGQTGGNTPHASFGIGSPGIVLRHPVRLPCTTSRWRLHIRNYDARDDLSYSGLITFSGAYVGVASLTAGAFTGVYAATPSQALAATTFEGSTEWVSPWVTDSAAQFQANTNHLLSSGVQLASGSQTSRGYGGIYWIIDKANVGQLMTPPGVQSSNTSALDMWIEYETEGDFPVGLYVGDSLTLGRRATADVGMLGSWPVAHAHRTRSLAINAGLSGASTGTWLTSTQYKWTKWGLGSAINPDYAVVGLGQNDIAGSVALATVQANFGSIVSILRGFGIDRVYAVTVPPRSLAGAQETDRVAYNKWLESLPHGIDGCFRADVPVTASGSTSVLDTAVDSGDLVHMTTAGYQRVAATIPGRLA